jgi:hypothetical protein
MAALLLSNFNSLSNLDDIHISSGDCLLKIKTVSNKNIYLKYKKGTKTFDDIKKFLFNDFKYSCDGYDNESMFDFKFNNIKLSQILPETKIDTESDTKTSIDKKFDTLSSNLLDLLSTTNTSLQLTLKYDKISNINKQSLQSEYDKIAHLFSSDKSNTLYIKTLDGKTVSLKCDLEKLTVKDIKIAICQKVLISIDNVRIIFGGKQLDGDSRNLSEYNIKNDSTLHIILRLRGGMFNEASGRNGSYEPLLSIFYDLDARVEIILQPDCIECCYKSSIEI